MLWMHFPHHTGRFVVVRADRRTIEHMPAPALRDMGKRSMHSGPAERCRHHGHTLLALGEADDMGKRQQRRLAPAKGAKLERLIDLEQRLPEWNVLGFHEVQVIKVDRPRQAFACATVATSSSLGTAA